MVKLFSEGKDKMKKETMEIKEFFAAGDTYKLWRTCGCGCGEVVKNVFAQGHDMRVKKHTK